MRYSVFGSHSRVPDLDPSITLPAVTPNVDVLTETYDMAFIGPPAPITEPDSVTVMKDNAEIHTGDLILINRNYPFNFDFEQPQTTLYSNKNRVYQLSTISLSLNSDLVPIFDTLLADFAQATGCKKVLVTSGFRSYQVQKDLYDSRVKSQGQEMADLYVALPGNSEHHAGLAIDMVIFTDGRQYYFPEYEDAAWLIEHAPDYGFILRYPQGKTGVTGIIYEPWHFRYVGTELALELKELGLCMEEYMAMLTEKAKS